MSRIRFVQLVCLLLAAAVLVGSAGLGQLLHPSYLRIDEEFGQGVDPASFPELTALRAMPGTMRAVGIHWLWIRSQKLKDEGKFYDAAQLAEMICKLQPRFPGVWIFHSWNMAWNISVATHTPQERWRWVSEGVRLLRDDGIRYNPNTIDLYYQLGWIYYFKMGGTLDDMHMYYKRYLAGEFHRVLGAPPHLADNQAAIDWITGIADAPASLAGLLAQPGMAQYVNDLAAVNVNLDLGLLDAYNTWSDDLKVRMVGQPFPQPANQTESTIQRLMTDPQRMTQRDLAVAFARRQTLARQYKLDPQWMLELTRKYGPLDWRLPWTHALYWSTFGVHHCRNLDLESINALNTDRVVLNSLKDLTSLGKATLTWNPQQPELPELMLLPEWRYIEAAHTEHIWMGQHITGDQDTERTFELLKDGHINYLVDAIQILYFAGQERRAQDLLDYIRNVYKPTDPQWKLPIQQFVIMTLGGDVVPRHQTMLGLLAGQMEQSYMARIQGLQEEAAFFLSRAQFFWEEYQKSDPPERNRIRSIRQIELGVALDLIAQLPTLTGSAIYQSLSLELRAELYDFFAEQMRQRTEFEGVDFDTLFPEPPGLAEVREQRAAEQPPSPTR